jgi:hypothetical protein
VRRSARTKNRENNPMQSRMSPAPLRLGAREQNGPSSRPNLVSSGSSQQPAGDTPGVAAAPVALAGAIVPGVATLIVKLSAHAEVFGVGITAIVGSMLVPPSCVISC